MKPVPLDYNYRHQDQASAIGKGRVTEVIVPFGHHKTSILLPLAASMSHISNRRWTTWITHCNPNKSDLICLGANIGSLRLLKLQKQMDYLWLILEVLKIGNSHMVITDHQRLSVNDLNQVEEAAELGDSYAMIVRTQ